MGYVDVVSEIGSLSIRARTLCGWGPRLKGLLGTSPDAEAVILVPCKSVHTYGMTYPIDVAFLGSSGEVLASYRNVGAGRRLRVSHSIAVLERPTSEEGWFSRHERVRFVETAAVGVTEGGVCDG